MTDPRQAFALLRGASLGELPQLCARYRVELLVAFGSAVRSGPSPRDLDIAALFADVQPDILGFLDAISIVAGSSHIDLMNLRAAYPVARERALVGCVVLFEARPGVFARAQMAAMTERMDTEWLRQLDLELMAR